MDFQRFSAKTVGDAVTAACQHFLVTSDKLEYEILEEGSTGFLGFNAKPAVIQARVKVTVEDKALQFLNDVFAAMKLDVVMDIAYDEVEKLLDIDLKGDELGILIGKRGQTLDSLQYLVSLVVNKKSENYVRVKLDTENYRERRKETLETLAKNISPSIYLAVRTPAQLRGILYSRTPMAGQSDEGSLASRLGLFNDGMLGSVYDLGTYDDTPLTSASEFNEQGTRSEELLFQNKLCQYVPNGGEVTIDNKYNNLDNAISDLSTMCVSYLNSDHDLAVLNKWKNSTYTGSGVFSGCSGYDYIRAHLGYRYFIKSSSLDFHAFMSDKASLYLTIENVGFAPAYRQFDTALILTNQETGESRRMKTEIDNRSIAGSDQSEFKIELDVRSFAKGTYQMNLEMKDPYTGQVIHFANAGSEESATVSVGRLVIP